MPEEWLIMNVSRDFGLAAALELAGEIRDRLVARVEVQQDADVAELERGVDEPDLLAGLRGGDGEVHRDRGAADAALGAEDRDHVRGLAAAVVVAACRRCRGDDRRVADWPCPSRASRPGGSRPSARRS